MHKLKLTEIGDSVGVMLPAELLAQMRLRVGDEVFVTEMPGGWRILTQDSEFEEQVRMGREFMKEHHAVLQALAK